MRFAVLILCSLFFALSIRAEDRYVCTPAPAGNAWQCTGGDDAQRPADSAPRQAVSPAAQMQITQPTAAPAPDNAARPVGPAPSVADAIKSAQSFDWVPRAQLSADVLRALPEFCEGAYVEPAYPVPLDVDPATLPINVGAQSLEYWRSDRAELLGDVLVTRGNQSLVMSGATVHEAEQSVDVAGGLTLREPGMLVVGDQAQVSLVSGAAVVSNARFVLQPNQLRGGAATLRRNEVGDLQVLDATFTRCEPGNNSWRLTSSEVRIDEGAKFGTARNAVLRVHDVPVLYTPFIRFPVTDERMSGWLSPEMGYSDSNGADTSLPYYLNLAPNYDATITPRYVSERGAALQGEARHLSDHARTGVGGAFLYHDDVYDGELSKDEFDKAGSPGNFEPADRWLIATTHDGQFGDLRTLIDYGKVSDLDYFRDLGTSLSVASQVDLNQLGAVAYGVGGLTLRVWAQDFQPLDDDGPKPYRRLPAVDADYQGTLLGPLHWSLLTSYADFDRPNGNLTGIDRINGKRTHIEPRLELPLETRYGFARFVAGYRYTTYDLQDVPIGADDDPDREIWMGSADTGLYFERDTQWFGAATVQTLEPRLFYLYQQYANQNALPQFDVAELDFTFDQLFRDNRFAGLDRIADANQLSAALTTRFLNPVTGAQRLRLSLGQTIYFEDRQVSITGTPDDSDDQTDSPLTGLIEAALGGDFSLLASATYDAPTPTGTKWAPPCSIDATIATSSMWGTGGAPIWRPCSNRWIHRSTGLCCVIGV